MVKKMMRLNKPLVPKTPIVPPQVQPPVQQAGNGGAPQPLQGSFKRGGKVPKTGAFKLHRGERVLNVKQAKSMPLAKLERAVTKKGK